MRMVRIYLNLDTMPCYVQISQTTFDDQVTICTRCFVEFVFLFNKGSGSNISSFGLLFCGKNNNSAYISNWNRDDQYS